jgi:hypothetical protein
MGGGRARGSFAFFERWFAESEMVLGGVFGF